MMKKNYFKNCYIFSHNFPDIKAVSLRGRLKLMFTNLLVEVTLRLLIFLYIRLCYMNDADNVAS